MRVPAALTGLIKRHNEPVIVQTVRSTVAAVLAYLVALQLSRSTGPPLTAPLTALLVVQVTLYTTLTTGVRRVASVVAGVLIATAFSALIGLSWWSLGVIILASLILGHLIRVDEFVAEVAISGMLVLGVAGHPSGTAGTALDRVVETLIGAVVGVALNAVIAPPVFVQPAGEAVEELAGQMRGLLLRIGSELRRGATVQQAAEWLHEARRLDDDVSRFDASLRRAEESTRLNPRVRQGAMARLVLRSGLDSLEVCTVVLRTLCRSLTELSQEREHQAALYAGEVAGVLDRLLADIAEAVGSFGRLITAQVTAGADQAERMLQDAVDRGWQAREHLAGLLHSHLGQWENWALHGSLLAAVDRLLDELDVEKRSRWLAEQLQAAEPEQPSLVGRVRHGVRSGRWRTPRRPGA